MESDDRSTGRARERGTTLTEAALVSIPFFLIIFSIMELGFLFRNYLTTSNTAAEASRAASVYGADPEADFQILRSAEHGIAAMGLENLELLVVFRAEGPNSQVPPSCLVASQNRPSPGGDAGFDQRDTHPAADDSVAECNRYTRGDFGLRLFNDINGNGQGEDSEDTFFFGCHDDYSVDRKWCPQVRDDAIDGGPAGGSSPRAGTDYVGVYVEAKHRYLTGFFTRETTLTSTKIVRIEPERN